jgi:ketosteroid isomerase-like protein
MRYILVTLVLIVGMFGAAFGECSSADKAALEAFDRAWGAAGQSGNKAALMDLYADDYMGLPGMQNKMSTIENTMKTFEANKNNPNPDKTTHDHYYINCTPNSATITHRNVIWVADGPGGKPGTFFSRSVHQLEKRGGKWMVVSNAGGGELDDYATLWYLEQDWNNAAPKRDKEWFEKNFAPEFVSVSSATGKLTNKKQELADMMDDKGTLEMTETTDMNVTVDGNLGMVTGIYRMKGKDEKGVAYDRKIRYIDTWIKRDGRWLAIGSAGANIKE